jgi:hypothetical protein
MTALQPTTKHLRAVTDELATVIRRHAPDWTAQAEHDPGITLVSCLAWFADTFAMDQARASDDSSLSVRRQLGLIAYHTLSDRLPVVTVEGTPWQPVPSDKGDQAGAGVYALEVGPGGETLLVFGGGSVGARPPADGSEVAVTYRSGAGRSGDARFTVTFRWPPQPGAVSVRPEGGLVIALPHCDL